MTLNEGQGHSLDWMLKNINFWPFLTMSQTLLISSRVMKPGQQVVYGDTLKMMWNWVTLTEGQCHSLYLKIGKYPF